MNVLNYYRNYYCKYYNNYVYLSNNNELSSDTHIYLYTLNNEIESFKDIASCYNCKYIPAEYIQTNTYIIFIPYNEYMFTLKGNIHNISLSIYTDKTFIMTFFHYYRINMIINWLNIDGLKEKLIKALNFIVINLQVLEKHQVLLNDDFRFLIKSTSSIYDMIHIFVNNFNFLITMKERYHYDIYENFNRLCHVQINKDNLIISNHSLDKYTVPVYYFSFNEDRNISFILYNNNIWVSFYTNNKLLFLDSSLECFKVIFKLINREDIYEKLSKIYERIRLLS